jgi:hypothetical protein
LRLGRGSGEASFLLARMSARVCHLTACSMDLRTCMDFVRHMISFLTSFYSRFIIMDQLCWLSYLLLAVLSREQIRALTLLLSCSASRGDNWVFALNSLTRARLLNSRFHWTRSFLCSWQFAVLGLRDSDSCFQTRLCSLTSRSEAASLICGSDQTAFICLTSSEGSKSGSSLESALLLRT